VIDFEKLKEDEFFDILKNKTINLEKRIEALNNFNREINEF